MTQMICIEAFIACHFVMLFLVSKKCWGIPKNKNWVSFIELIVFTPTHQLSLLFQMTAAKDLILTSSKTKKNWTAFQLQTENDAMFLCLFTVKPSMPEILNVSCSSRWCSLHIDNHSMNLVEIQYSAVNVIWDTFQVKLLILKCGLIVQHLHLESD